MVWRGYIYKIMEYLINTIYYLLDGAKISLAIFFVTLLGAFPLAIILVIMYKQKIIYKQIISLYTWLFRGTPLMLQLFFFMYLLPFLGVYIDRLVVALITFILNYTAYFIEILRAGIESIPKEQYESAMVEGANNKKIYQTIILPQAIRKQLPTITNEVITLIKDTSLVTVIAISDLMRGVKEIVSRDFTFSPFILAALFYLIISYIIILIMRNIEKKIDFFEFI